MSTKFILVVDDNLTFIQLFQMFLIKKNFIGDVGEFIVHYFTGAADAINAIRTMSTPYHVVLADLNIHEGGEGVTVALEARQRKKDTGIIILSDCFNGPPNRIWDIKQRSQADECVPKPFTKERVLVLVENMLLRPERAIA